MALASTSAARSRSDADDDEDDGVAGELCGDTERLACANIPAARFRSDIDIEDDGVAGELGVRPPALTGGSDPIHPSPSKMEACTMIGESGVTPTGSGELVADRTEPSAAPTAGVAGDAIEAASDVAGEPRVPYGTGELENEPERRPKGVSQRTADPPSECGVRGVRCADAGVLRGALQPSCSKIDACV